MADEEGKLKVKSWDASSMELGSERVPNVYTNNAQIGFSNWDAWIQFGEILGEREGRLLVAPKVRVVMSLQHVKAFLTALNDSIAKFESTFGDIGQFVRDDTNPAAIPTPQGEPESSPKR
jgi:hypothetical protein